MIFAFLERMPTARRSECAVEAGWQKWEKGMPFPNVPRKSNVEAETFDLRAYVRELFLAIALGNLPNKKPES